MSITELDRTKVQDIDDTDTLLLKLQDNVEKWYSYYAENNDKYERNIEFILNSQWEPHEIADYNLRQKVLLTVNVLYPIIMQILAEQRQNSAQIKVESSDGSAEQSEINMVEGVLRQIAYDSNSDLAHQTAFMTALLGGYGVWHIDVDYESHNSFYEAIKITPEKTPLNCYFDPSAQNECKTDGEYCGFYSRLTPEEFATQYPEIYNPVSVFPPVNSNMLNGVNWYDGKTITLCNHYQKVYTKTKLYKLSNGDAVLADELDETLKFLEEERQKKIVQMLAQWRQSQQGTTLTGTPESLNSDLIDMYAPKITVVDERETTITKIKQYKFIKGLILEEGEFYGHMLPMIYVAGDNHMAEGKEQIKSFAEFARDMQRYLNYNVSEVGQSLKMAHKGKFLVTAQQINQYKKIWSNPESPAMALPYDPDPRTNNAPPVYIPATEVSASLLQNPTMILNLIQTVLGRYEANRGQQGNEQSGIAINNRSKQGNLAVFVYLDNLNRAIEESAKVCLHLLPYVMTENRNVKVRGQDGKTSFKVMAKQDLERLKRMKYDVRVKSGSPFEVQKADSYAELMTFVQLNPQQFAPLLADLLAENLNVSNTQQIVDRLKQTVVPPQVIAQENGQPIPPTPPNPQVEIAKTEAQARLMEAQAKLQKVQEDSNAVHMKTQAEVGKAMLDYQGKAQEYQHDIAKQNLETHATVAQAHSDIVKAAMGAYAPSTAVHQQIGSLTGGRHAIESR